MHQNFKKNIPLLRGVAGGRGMLYTLANAIY